MTRGLQAWGRRSHTYSAPETMTEPVNKQDPKSPKGQELGQGQGQVPPPTPRLPHEDHFPPVGHHMAPTDVPIVRKFPIPLITLTPTPL